MSKKILLMDNDTDSLDTRAELLENADYKVVKASTLEQAKTAMRNTWIDLAILDIRVSNEDDDNDISGLLLAQDPEFSAIPKIILTAYPSFEYAREVLARDANGNFPAVNFISKNEIARKFLDAVDNAFTEHVHVNEQLKFISQQAQPFVLLVNEILGSNLTNEEIFFRSLELENLFRKLFYDYDDAVIEIIPTTQMGLKLLWVELRKGDKEIPKILVKCGSRRDIEDEIHAGEDFRRGQLIKNWAISQESAVISIHFGAITFSSAGFDLSHGKWLIDYFRSQNDTKIKSALSDLYGEKVKYLYNQPCDPEMKKSLALIYQEALGCSNRKSISEKLQHNVTEIALFMLSTYMISLIQDAKKRNLSFTFPDGTQLSCLDPINLAYKLADSFGPPVLRRISLGGMDGYNVLVDPENRTLLTEFKSIGPATNLIDFITLEAKIRFEWIDNANLKWNELRDFENAFIPSTSRSLDNSVQIEQHGIPDLDKALAVIAHLRKLAARAFGNNLQEYQIGLLFQVIGILVSSDEISDRKIQDRKAHALMAAAMICQYLEQSQ